jgi:hypothetical protein
VFLQDRDEVRPGQIAHLNRRRHDDRFDSLVWLANKIGRIEPKTFAIKEYDTPLKGPRRPRFDRNGSRPSTTAAL